VLNLPDLRSR